MKIEKIIDSLNDTNVYIIYDECSKNSIIIDLCNFENVSNYISNNELVIDYVILTHEHYDHILGLNELRQMYKFKVIALENCSKAIQNSKKNLSSFFDVLLYFKKKDSNVKIKPYESSEADITFNDFHELNWNNHVLKMYETPGHSKGSISIVLDNEYLFSGDSLLKDLEVITRFPGGSTKDYENITLPFYNSLDMNMRVYPGHGREFVLNEVVDKLQIK